MTRENPTPLTLWLGAKIAKLRKSKRLTQQQLEASAGFHQGHISRIENGLILPDLKSLIAISKVLEMTVSKLLSGIDDEDV